MFTFQIENYLFYSDFRLFVTKMGVKMKLKTGKISINDNYARLYQISTVDFVKRNFKQIKSLRDGLVYVPRKSLGQMLKGQF